MVATSARTALCRPSPGRTAPVSDGAASDAELLLAIGRDLAAVYAEVLRQPLPANVKALITHINAHHGMTSRA